MNETNQRRVAAIALMILTLSEDLFNLFETGTDMLNGIYKVIRDMVQDEAGYNAKGREAWEITDEMFDHDFNDVLNGLIDNLREQFGERTYVSGVSFHYIYCFSLFRPSRFTPVNLAFLGNLATLDDERFGFDAMNDDIVGEWLHEGIHYLNFSEPLMLELLYSRMTNELSNLFSNAEARSRGYQDAMDEIKQEAELLEQANIEAQLSVDDDDDDDDDWDDDDDDDDDDWCLERREQD